MTKIVRKFFAVHFHCFWSSCKIWPTTQIFCFSGSRKFSIFGAYVGTSGKLSQVAGLGCSEKIIEKKCKKFFRCTFPLFLVKLLDLAFYSKLCHSSSSKFLVFGA